MGVSFGRESTITLSKKLDIEDESLPFIIGTGSYTYFQKQKEAKEPKRIVGFVRPKANAKNRKPDIKRLRAKNK